MSESIAGNFVRSLKEKLSEEKNQIQRKRILLQDSFDIILEVFRTHSDLEIRTIRDFETSEISFFVDVYSPSDQYESIKIALEKSGILINSTMLGEYKCLFIVDLENRLIASGNPHNIFSIEIFSKRLRTFKLKISHCDPNFTYSVFEKNYHEIKYWYYENCSIEVKSIRLKDFDRDKEKINISDDETNHEIEMTFNEIGELNNFNLFQKKGRKNKK
ncbi:MAG: hypothetical protein EBZ95_12200 [Chitinophagia bacterium]|nr:hypothetical protein [Chitinophagia bacterium]